MIKNPELPTQRVTSSWLTRFSYSKILNPLLQLNFNRNQRRSVAKWIVLTRKPFRIDGFESSVLSLCPLGIEKVIGWDCSKEYSIVNSNICFSPWTSLFNDTQHSKEFVATQVVFEKMVFLKYMQLSRNNEHKNKLNVSINVHSKGCTVLNC